MEDDGFEAVVVRSAYAGAVDTYAATFGDDLAQLPLDRRVLDHVAAVCTGSGPVLDAGCGPAQLAAYLGARGVACVGLDITLEMLKVATRRAAGLSVVEADVRALPFADATFAGVVAFYVLQHLRREELRAVAAEVRRVLAADGVIALAVHAGDGTFAVGAVTATCYTREELSETLTAAAFRVELLESRAPLAHERQGERFYLLARAT